MPTYNREDLIVAALDSIAEQDYRPIEIIVVDDGSTDKTAEVVRAWCRSLDGEKDLTLRLIRQSNRGGNAARNAGILASTGELVAFLDSDDRWHPTKLSLQCDLLASKNRIGGVYCGVRHVALDSGTVIESSGREYPAGSILDAVLVRDVTAPTSTYLVRRRSIDKVGLFDEDLAARQDWDMWIRIAAEYDIGAVPMPLVDYGEHSGPRTATDPSREISAYKAIRAKYASLRAGRSIRIRLSALSAYYRRMGRVYFHGNLGKLKALGFYLLALVSWPFDFDNYAALGGWFLPANLRGAIHRGWNRIFGSTFLAIRSH